MAILSRGEEDRRLATAGDVLIDGAVVHLVRVGNYVGQNFGLITRISESELQLKEIVQDAAGEWVERPAKLELQEAMTRTAQGGKR